MTEDYESDGKGALSLTVNRNTFLQQSIDFMEKMTTATKQGWPDISGDEFLSALADATNHWLSSCSNSWQLRDRLMAYLSSEDAPSRLSIALEPRGSVAARTQLTEIVKQAMRKEFTDYLMALQRPMRGGGGGIKGIQIARMIADTVWAYGSRRNAGEAYLLTMSHYLSDGNRVVGAAPQADADAVSGMLHRGTTDINKVYTNATMDTYYQDQPAHLGSDCILSFNDDECELKYDDDDGKFWSWKGIAQGQGHYKLKANHSGAQGSLHMFEGARIMDGYWSENGFKGMWRVYLKL